MLKDLTSDPSQLKSMDISITAQVISELIFLAASDEQVPHTMHNTQWPSLTLYHTNTLQVRNDILDTIQNLLKANREALATSEQESQSTSRSVFHL